MISCGCLNVQLAARMDGYLAKPIRSEELYALLAGFQGTLVPVKAPVSDQAGRPTVCS